MLKKAKRTIILFIIAAFFAGCAGTPVADKSKSGEIAPSDSDIMQEALTYLNTPERVPDYNAAKANLELLLQKYPQSKLAESTQALILTINDLLVLQLQLKNEKHALDKANAEKAKLRKDYKSSEERYQVENIKLQQENEQLKNDIAVLKKLEIQMDKREKMLK